MQALLTSESQVSAEERMGSDELEANLPPLGGISGLPSPTGFKEGIAKCEQQSASEATQQPERPKPSKEAGKTGESGEFAKKGSDQ